MPRCISTLASLRWALALTIGAAVLGSTATAQLLDSALPSTRLLTVFPPGGKAGTTVEVAFTGADLEEPEQMLFSHPGIKAEPIVPPIPPPADPKNPPKQPPPRPPVTKFKVTIPADVSLGVHDVRIVNKWGVSNPRAFVVGDLTEVLEKEPNDDIDKAQRVELNSTINGNLTGPVDVDYYVFAGKKGQRVVFSCLSSSIDSRFHPEIQVYDSKGRRLATGRDYNNTDALTDAVLPEDGDYYVRLFEFTHTVGTPEHFYRLSITTAPWIDAVHPPTVEPGKTATLTIWGRNLPGGKLDPTAVVDDQVLEKITVSVNAPADPGSRQRLAFSGRLLPASVTLDGFEYRLKNDSGASNPMLIGFASAPVVLDNETARTAATPQEITVPCEIAGRIEKRRDRDWYVFNAKKGEAFNIEVLSERLGSPTSMYFVLRNPVTSQDIFESPDNTEVVPPKFYARSEDPQPYRFVAPADGKYLLLVSSRLADVLSGPRHLYRVRITPDQPDFHLSVQPFANTRPDAGTLRQGGDEGFTVIAYRHDNFTGDIALTVEGLPAGVTCPPQTLGSGVRQTTLIVSAADTAPPSLGEIKIKGTANINGQVVVREARPGGIVWPLAAPAAPTPTISRIDRGLFLAVRDKAPFKLTATLDKPQLFLGDKGTLTVKLSRLWPDFKQPLAVQAIDVPPNLLVNNNQPITIAPDKAEAALPIQVNANVQPGVYNMVLRANAPIPYNRDPKAPQKPPTLVVQVAVPVTLSIVPKSLATLTIPAGPPTVKAGGQVEMVVRVARQFNYTGEFKIEIVVPPAVKGLTFDPAVIPAGQDEVKVIVKAPADSMPGNRGGLIVRATALYNPTTPTASPDVPLNVNVVK
jgi:hypothetical protein